MPLIDTLQQDLPSLTSESGRTAAPTTPMETSVIGGNADQAKMAGTPASKLNALRDSIDPSQKLTTAKRTENLEAKKNTGEQEAFQTQQELKGMGYLNELVGAKITATLSGSGSGAAATSLKLNDSKIAQYTTDPVALATLRAQLPAAAAGDQSALAKVAGIMGKGFATDITVDGGASLRGEISKLFFEGSSGSAEEVASRVQNTVTFGEMDLTTAPAGFGYSNVADLATDMGLTEDQLKGMTIKQVGDHVRKIQSERFNESEDRRNRATNPALSDSDREAARRELRQAAASGVKATEAEFNKLASEVEAGNTIKFGDRDMSIEELLNDDFLKGVTKSYLDNPEGPAAQKLRREQPGFTLFLDSNAAVMRQLTKTADSSVATIVETAKQNQETFDKIGLNSAVLAAGDPTNFDPKKGLKISAGLITPVGAAAALTSPRVGAADRVTIAESLNQASKVLDSATLTNWVSTATPELLLRAGLNDATKTEELLKKIGEVGVLSSLDPVKDEKQIMDIALSQYGVTQEELNSFVLDFNKLDMFNDFGVGPGGDLMSMFRNTDGTMRTPAQVRDAFLIRGRAASSLEDLAAHNGNIGMANPRTLLDDLKTSFSSSPLLPLFNKLSSYMPPGSGGTFTPSVLDSINKDPNVSLVDIAQISTVGRFPNDDNQYINIVIKDRAVAAASNNVVAGFPGTTSMASLKSKINSTPREGIADLRTLLATVRSSPISANEDIPQTHAERKALADEIEALINARSVATRPAITPVTDKSSIPTANDIFGKSPNVAGDIMKANGSPTQAAVNYVVGGNKVNDAISGGLKDVAKERKKIFGF